MAVPAHSSVLYDVNDFKVSALLTDTATAPTYSAVVDVPGVASCSLQPNLKTAELKGDAKIIAKRGSLEKYQMSATYGRLSLEALAVFFGGTVTDGASDATWGVAGTNALPYFKAEFSTLQGEVADAHVVGWKSQATGGTLFDQSTDNFGQPKIDFECIPCISDDTKFVDIVFYDAATPIV